MEQRTAWCGSFEEHGPHQWAKPQDVNWTDPDLSSKTVRFYWCLGARKWKGK